MPGTMLDGAERGLLDLGVIVVDVAVQLDDPDLDQRIVGVRPDLGQIEGVPAEGLGLGFGHHLDAEPPAREVAALDGLEQVTLGALAVVGDDRVALGVGPVPDALHRLEVELHPDALIGVVDEAVGVAAEAVQEAIALRQAAIAEQGGDLVQAFRAQRPVVPHRRGRAQVGHRMALLGADEVGELQRIADEEHGGVVAHHVPVALLGVGLDREAAHVALRVGRAALASHGREPHQDRRLLAHFGQEPGLGVAADVLGHRQRAIGARALGVDDAFRHPFAVLVGQLFQQLIILHQQGSARTGAERVLVVGDRRAARRGQGLVGHGGLRRVDGLKVKVVDRPPSCPTPPPATGSIAMRPPALRPWLKLGRFDRPAGIWLLMLPGWQGIALAAAGKGQWPNPWLLIAFFVGAALMRAAGCAFNDIVDRDFDAQVSRTAMRPIPAGLISVKQAWAFVIGCCLVSFLILLCLGWLASAWACCRWAWSRPIRS
jgi:hypothetical protein